MVLWAFLETPLFLLQIVINSLGNSVFVVRQTTYESSKAIISDLTVG